MKFYLWLERAKKIVAFFYHGINVDINNEGDFIKKKHPPLLSSYEGKRISQEQDGTLPQEVKQGLLKM
ncbi:hypothetical protein [Acinetobacter lwoffii]|uniref:hypothetical protein n=1 Tax=Acinetobacter lwoffii TaxID=28090 RepID=UPI003F8D2328